MTTRAAARPLRRHPKARARAATLPASYTATGDTTGRGRIRERRLRGQRLLCRRISRRTICLTEVAQGFSGADCSLALDASYPTTPWIAQVFQKVGQVVRIWGGGGHRRTNRHHLGRSGGPNLARLENPVRRVRAGARHGPRPRLAPEERAARATAGPVQPPRAWQGREPARRCNGLETKTRRAVASLGESSFVPPGIAAAGLA